MRKNMLFGGVLSALFLATAPVHANISAVVEAPVDMGSVSGLDQVAGHVRVIQGGDVVDPDSVNLTVRLRVNFQTRPGNAGIIPVTTIRNDVDLIFKTGFSFTLPYGALPFGLLAIGVEVSADGEDTVIIDRFVSNISIDGTETPDPDLSGAACSVSNGTISLTGIPTGDLGIIFSTGEQEFNINTSTAEFSVEDGEAVLTQGQETAVAVVSNGSGQGFITWNENAPGDFSDDTFTVSLVATGLTGDPAGAHIHSESPGVDGPVIIDLGAATGDAASARWEGIFSIDAMFDAETEVGNFQNGNWYFNVHTPDNGPGEVRGQILPAGTMPGCADSSRVFFTTGSPPNPGNPGAGVPNIGCRALSQAHCNKGWQFAGGSSAFPPASCGFNDTFMVCVGCGPNNAACDTCAP